MLGIVKLSTDENQVNKMRKRPMNPSEWACNKRKRLRDAGLSYVSKTGAEIPAKAPPSMVRVCDKLTCFRRGCSDLDLQRKMKFFYTYHGHTYDEQSALLVSLMTFSEVKRSRKSNVEAASRRSCTFRYYLDNLEVCRKTFLDTFQITKRRVETLQNKMKKDVDLPVDGRGKHRNRPHSKQDFHNGEKKYENDCSNFDLNLSNNPQSLSEKHPGVETLITPQPELLHSNYPSTSSSSHFHLGSNLNENMGVPLSHFTPRLSDLSSLQIDNLKFCLFMFNEMNFLSSEKITRKLQIYMQRGLLDAIKEDELENSKVSSLL